MSEGYIKFICEHKVKASGISSALLDAMNACRNTLKSLGWMGVLEDGVGYGNISIREKGNRFWISSTGTGALDQLEMESVSRVTAWDTEKNSLHCEGKMPASSESLSHAVIYDMDLFAAAVIHIHSKALWRATAGMIPETRPEFDFGTAGIATDIRRLYDETDLRYRKTLRMAGHEDGLIAYGLNLQEALQGLLNLEKIYL